MVGHDSDGAQQRRSVVRLDGSTADEAVTLVGDHPGRERLGRPIEGQSGRGQEVADGRPVAGLRALGLHQQQPVPPQQPASATGSISRGAERSMSGRASAGFVALMIALIIPSTTVCDGVIGDVGQADRLQALAELRDRQGARDAAGVGAALGALLGAQRVLGHDVADPDPAARPQDPGDLGEDCVLVGSEVHDAVADDDVDRLGRQRQRLDVALQELDVRGPGLGGVRLGEREHLVGHVDPEGPAGRPDPLGRQEDIDPTAGAEVEDPLARMQVGDRGRVAAAERRQDRGVGQLVALERRVQVRPDGLGIAATRGALGGADRGVGVVLPDGLVDGLGGHRWSAPRC